MGIVWSRGNVFTAYDMPAYVEVNIPYVHRLKCYDEITTYVDDTATGRNRPTQPYELRLWSENPRGIPPTTPAIHEVKCEVYDTQNTMKERYTLRYLYGRAKYLVYIQNESEEQLGAYIVYMFGSEFFRSVHATNVGIPEKPEGYDLFFEVLAQKDGKKYYYVAKNPSLLASTVLKLYPTDKAYITITYDLSRVLAWVDIPVIGSVVKFWVWLGERLTNYAIAVASWFSNIVGIRLPVVEAKIDWEKKELVVIYENDPAQLIVIILMACLTALGVALILAIRDMKVAEYNYKITELTNKVYTQYYEIVKEVTSYAQETPTPSATVNEILAKLSPPQLPLETASTVNRMSSELEDLKKILTLAIGGGIIIAILGVVRK